jgi:hypothetical protein
LQPAARLTERNSILLFSFKLSLNQAGNTATRPPPDPVMAATSLTLLDAARISRIPWRTATLDKASP